MLKKYQNKYRTQSTRLQHWDYSWNAAYFVTLCSKNKQACFGQVINEQMQLSSLGILADVLWFEIKNHAKNIELNAFVVMPNHLHGILILQNETPDVETRHALSLQKSKTLGQQRFQNQGKNSLSSIIGSYKSAVTKHAHRLGFDFSWQPRFYEHIIRNEKSYQYIENYILENPKKWSLDRFYIVNK